MNQQAVNERLKAAPNPVIDNYHKITYQHHQQVIDQNHVGWRILVRTVYKQQQKFFNAKGHWQDWHNSSFQSLVKNEVENAVSIGVTLTQYWQGKSLNLMQTAMIKPYLKLDQQKFLH